MSGTLATNTLGSRDQQKRGSALGKQLQLKAEINRKKDSDNLDQQGSADKGFGKIIILGTQNTVINEERSAW